MTTNQLRYWELQENRRKNRAVEGETKRSNLAKEAETLRSNQAREFQTGLSIAESKRHNLVGEEQAQTRLESDLKDAKVKRAATTVDTFTKGAKNISDTVRNIYGIKSDLAGALIGAFVPG